MKKSGNLVIGYDFSNGEDNSVLIVGTQEKGQPVKIVNAFQGKDAEALYEMLTKKEGEKK